MRLKPFSLVDLKVTYLVGFLAEVALVIAEKASSHKRPHVQVLPLVTITRAWLAVGVALDWQSLAQKTFVL